MPPVKSPAYSEAPRGTETVLLAEDEADVRELAREFLEAAGYTVIEARNGQEALKLAGERSEEIDLLVSDLVMPGMTGQQLAALLQQQDSSLRVIFMSGYSEHAAAEAAQAGSAVRILTKPFNRMALLRTIREVLGPPFLAEIEVRKKRRRDAGATGASSIFFHVDVFLVLSNSW